MKSKLLVILVVLFLSVGIMGCSSGDPVKEPEKTTDNQEPIKDESTLDSSLEGLELFKSINNKQPETMKMTMVMEGFNTETTSVVYYQKDNTRTETLVEGSNKSVLIFNAEQEEMYSYIEGAQEGLRIVGVDISSAEESGLTMDLSLRFNELSNEVTQDVIARVEQLNDEEVVYIETTQADDEFGNILVKMWYSTTYNVPLKYEVIMGEQLLTTITVTEIEKDIKLDSSLFEAPADITLQEVDISDLMQE